MFSGGEYRVGQVVEVREYDYRDEWLPGTVSSIDAADDEQMYCVRVQQDGRHTWPYSRNIRAVAAPPADRWQFRIVYRDQNNNPLHGAWVDVEAGSSVRVIGASSVEHRKAPPQRSADEILAELRKQDDLPMHVSEILEGRF